MLGRACYNYVHALMRTLARYFCLRISPTATLVSFAVLFSDFLNKFKKLFKKKITSSNLCVNINIPSPYQTRAEMFDLLA